MPNLECEMRDERHVEVPKGEHFSVTYLESPLPVEKRLVDWHKIDVIRQKKYNTSQYFPTHSFVVRQMQMK